MAFNLMPMPKQAFHAVDASGRYVPIVGGKVYTYQAGTTTPKATYTDSTGGTAQANPVVLDARGEASVWLADGLYKIVLKDANDAEIWTVDGVSGSGSGSYDTVITSLRANAGLYNKQVINVLGCHSVGDGGGGVFYWDSTSTATETIGTIVKPTAIDVSAQGRWKRIYEGALNVKWFGAKGDGTTDDSAAFHAAIAIVAANDGGQIDIPFGRGETYAVNLTIADKRGIHLNGTSLIKQNPRTTTFALTDCLIASDVSSPILTIGDDIGTNGDNQTSGIVLSNIPFSGQGTAEIGLRLKGGAHRNFYNNLSFAGFTVAAISASATINKTLFYQYFSGLGIHCTTTGSIGIAVDGSATGTTTTNVTSLYFDNGYIACWSDAASRCVYCYSASISMSNMYLQLAGDGIGVELRKSAATAIPSVSCSQVTIDGDSVKPAIYANIPNFDAAGDKDLSRYIYGSFTCDGSVKLQDATTNDMMLGKFGFTYKQLGFSNKCIDRLNFANSVYPEYDGLLIAVGGGVNPQLTFTAPNGVNVTTAWYVASTKVVGARVTGWAATYAGSATRSTFDTTTVTTAQLAERVKALLDDLITHGLIGA